MYYRKTRTLYRRSSVKNRKTVTFGNHQETLCKLNNPGPAKVGAIAKAQKQQKYFKVSKYSLLQHPKKCSEKMSRNAGKTEKNDPLVLSGIVCYAGNLFGSVPGANRGILIFVELLV